MCDRCSSLMNWNIQKKTVEDLIQAIFEQSDTKEAFDVIIKLVLTIPEFLQKNTAIVAMNCCLCLKQSQHPCKILAVPVGLSPVWRIPSDMAFSAFTMRMNGTGRGDMGRLCIGFCICVLY